MVDYERIEALDKDTGNVNVIIETPKGSRNKYKFDEDLRIFKLSKVLPAGAVFPFDFGFVPSTLAPDGDPLDILVLMDEPAFPGCLIEVRLLGVIKAKQKPMHEKWRRNDRLIGVFYKSKSDAAYRNLSDLGENLLDEMEWFFTSYHKSVGNIFQPLKREGVASAKKLLKEAMQRFKGREA